MAYSPTHDVPDGGLPAWREPDPARPPATTLGAGLDVAVAEMRGAWARIVCSNGWEGWVDGTRLVPRVQAPVAPAPAPAPVETVIAPGAAPEPSVTETAAEPEPLAPVPAPEPAPQPAPAPAPAPYVATHTAGEGGLQAWDAPDPTRAPVATLAPGTPLRLAEVRGQWGRVEAENGWEGWVDTARLVQVGAPAPAPTPAPAPAAPSAPTPAPAPAAPSAPTPAPAPAVPSAPTQTVLVGAPPPPGTTPAPGVAARPALVGAQVAALVGAAVAALATVLPWVDFEGESENAFEPPAQFLWDYQTDSDTAFTIGLVVIVLAIGGAVFSLLRDLGVVRRITGGVIALVSVVFIIQLSRLLDDFPGAPGVFDTLAVGTYLALAGGVLLAAVPTPSSR